MIYYVLSMAIFVVVSNILVLFPVNYQLGSLNLAEYLTYGAITYPFTFIINDMTNYNFGEFIAKKIVIYGFITAVIITFVIAYLGFSTYRIAIASTIAFIIAQLFDTKLFTKFQFLSYYVRPLLSSQTASVIDTLIFFFLAFSLSVDKILLSLLSHKTFEAQNLSGFSDWFKYVYGDILFKTGIVFISLIPYRYFTKNITKNKLTS